MRIHYSALRTLRQSGPWQTVQTRYYMRNSRLGRACAYRIIRRYMPPNTTGWDALPS